MTAPMYVPPTDYHTVTLFPVGDPDDPMTTVFTATEYQEVLGIYGWQEIELHQSSDDYDECWNAVAGAKEKLQDRLDQCKTIKGEKLYGTRAEQRAKVLSSYFGYPQITLESWNKEIKLGSGVNRIIKIKTGQKHQDRSGRCGEPFADSDRETVLYG